MPDLKAKIAILIISGFFRRVRIQSTPRLLSALYRSIFKSLTRMNCGCLRPQWAYGCVGFPLHCSHCGVSAHSSRSPSGPVPFSNLSWPVTYFREPTRTISPGRVMTGNYKYLRVIQRSGCQLLPGPLVLTCGCGGYSGPN